MNKGIVRKVGDQRVDVQLIGSATTLMGVPVSTEVDLSTLNVGTQVLVDLVNGRHVVLATLITSARSSALVTESARAPSGGIINNALLADGSVALTGNLPVTPGVTIDGYDISVLGQAISNLQAADTVARTGHTVLTHASHLVGTIGPDDDQVLIRDAIFADKETLVVSDNEGNVEFMRVIGAPQPAVDDRGAPCWRYTVTRRTQTSPAGIVVGWAAATLVNGLTHKGFISVDARNNSLASPNLRFVMHTDIDAGATEQIVRLGNVRGILGNGDDDYGFAVGRLNTGDRYFAYNYNRNLLALRGADIEVSDPAGVPVFRVWAVAENDHDAGDTRLGKASGGHIETSGNEVGFFAGSQRIMHISPNGARFRGMIWSGDQPGPGVGIGRDDDQGLIAARNAAGLGQFVVRTGDENVHIHMGNPVALGGYAQFANGEFTTDGIIRARAFELLGGGTINPGSTLTNAGKFTAGTGNNVAVIDGEDAAWRVYAGHATPASAPFRVNQAGEAWLTNAHVSGEINATAGVFGGWTLNSTYLGAINVGLAPTDYPFFAGSTYDNRASAPFRVTPAGALTATSGTVGGWTLSANSLTGGNATLHNSGYLNLGTSNDIARLDAADATYRLWVGHATADSAPFRVTKAGVLTASSANITGTVNATAGNFTGSVYVGAAAPRIHLDGVNKRIESTNFASGTSGFRIDGSTGNAEFNDVDVRGSLRVAVLQYGHVLATNGSIWVTPVAGKTIASFTTVDSPSTFYINVEDPDGMSHAAAGSLWATSDIVRVQEPLTSGTVASIWATISAKTDMSTYWRLTVVKQSPGAGLNYTFSSGATVLNYKQSGAGLVRITADASNSPYISIATHAGSPWTTLTERARLGNLAGISGASGYGLWSNNAYLTGEMYITNPEDIVGSTITNDLGWSEGANLLVNGTVENGTDHWSDGLTHTIGAYEGTACLKKTGHYNAIWNETVVPVDTGAPYELAAAFRSDKASTYLIESVSQGATTIKIVPPASDWTTHLAYSKGIQFGVQALGADQPNYTARLIAYSNGIVKTNSFYWTVTLEPGYSVPQAYPAGTAVGLSSYGGTFDYSLIGSEQVGTSWVRKTALYQNENAWNTPPANNQFRKGTKKIKFVVLANYGSETDTTYIDAASFAQVSQTAVTAGQTASSFFGSDGSLVNTPNPSTAGLYLSRTHMGYWNGSAWRTYMDNSGRFYFSGSAGARIAWDGTDLLGTNGSTVQWYARASTGKLYAGGGSVTLDSAGITATAGNIAGWTLAEGHLFTGAGTGRAGMQPATHPFYAGSETPAGAPFRVTRTGTLTATGANITGTITANAGAIGGWTINSSYLVKDTGTNSTSSGMSPADYPFFAGSTYNNRASAPFRVDPAGGLYATAGSVAGFTISYTEGLYAGQDDTRVQMKSGSGFWAGATARDSAPFRVTNAGVLTANNVNISAGNGDVSINNNGIRLNYSTATTSYLGWFSGNTLKAALSSFSDNGTNTMRLDVQSGGNLHVTAGYTKFDGKIRVTGGILQYGGTLAFFSTNPVDSGVSKQTVTGSRGGNAALASLLTALAAYGLITDSTTA